MSTKRPLVVLVAVATLAAACGPEWFEQPDDPGTQPAPEPGAPPGPPPADLPASRSFHMAIGPWPHEFGLDGLQEAVRIVREHADMVMHHLDWGVPWQEAYEGKPYPKEVEDELRFRAAARRPGQKVYLAAAPQASDRDRLAPYWGKDWEMPLPDPWKSRYCDHPAVIQAYTNWMRDLIRRFDPDYVAYGIEVTDAFTPDDPKFGRFLVLARQVHETLKREHPGLPVFCTLVTVSRKTDVAGLTTLARKVLPHSDFVAISTYPNWDYSDLKSRADPDLISRDWFDHWHGLAPDKPFAISETSFPAEDLVMPRYNVHQQGRPEWQREYVAWLLREAQRLDAVFVSWFIPRDYDKMWSTLQAQGADDFFKLWRDTGLLDGQGRPRPACTVWDAWRALPHQR